MGGRVGFLASNFAILSILDGRSGVLASKSGIFLSRRTLSVEVGRGKALTRADTPHGEPAALADAAGIQATTAVVQVVLEVAIDRGSRPPVAAGAGTAERATAVEPTIDRREGGAISSDGVELSFSW